MNVELREKQEIHSSLAAIDILFCSVRTTIITVLVCCVLYTAAIWSFGALLAPDSADGSLIRDANGRIIGSRQIAQKFTREEYFWPRPSAVDYNAAGTGGSNLSPLNPKITERAKAIIQTLGPSASAFVTADLVTASGSGIDPHITESGAIFQAQRVAHARGLEVNRVERMVQQQAQSPEGLGLADSNGRIVNVLLLNLAMDRQFGTPR